MDENITIDADYSISEDDILAAWGDEDVQDADQQTVQDEADETTSEEQEESTDDKPAEAGKPADDEPADDKPAEESEQTFKLKYMGEEIEVTREEAIVLAQKGKDYDRIRAERDEFKQASTEHEDNRKFLEEIAAPLNKTIEQLKLDARAAMLVKNEGITMEQAINRIKSQVKTVETKNDAADERISTEQAAAAERARQIKEFIAEYGNVDPKEIAPEVWADVEKGNTLLSAYRKWENAQLKEKYKQLQAELEAERKAQENKKKSTGSRQTSGNSKDTLDEYEKDWYSDD